MNKWRNKYHYDNIFINESFINKIYYNYNMSITKSNRRIGTLGAEVRPAQNPVGYGSVNIFD